MDEISAQVGVRPSLLKLLLTDPRLGLKVLLGPVTPYQYRLTGPGKWAGARQAILTQWERVTQALNTRPEDPPELPRSSTPTLVLSLMVAGLATTAYYCKGSLATLQWDPTALLDRIKVYLPGP